jgi:hypothetical protein
MRSRSGGSVSLVAGFRTSSSFAPPYPLIPHN